MMILMIFSIGICIYFMSFLIWILVNKILIWENYILVGLEEGFIWKFDVFFNFSRLKLKILKT